MKNFGLFLFSLLTFTFLSHSANAQDNADKNYSSVGLDVAVPTGSLAGFHRIGFGASYEYEIKLSEKFGLGSSITYMSFAGRTIERYNGETHRTSQSHEVPVQVFLRYHLSGARQGLFTTIKAGANLYPAEIMGKFHVNGLFTAAPELGYFINPKISFALRYQNTFFNRRLPGYTVNSYFSLRAAFNF